MNKKINSINFKIVLSILLCSIIIGTTVGSIILSRAKDIVKENIQKELMLILENKGYEFENVMDNISSLVENLSDTAVNLFDTKQFKENDLYLEKYISEMDKVIKRYSENTKQSVGTYITLNPELKNKAYGIWYTNINGKVEKQESITIEEFNRDNEYMNYYYKAVDNKAGTWIDPYMEDDINKYLISYTKPVYVDNLLIGVVGMDIDFDLVKNAVKEIKLYDTGYAFLLSKEYNFLVHPTFNINDNLKDVENRSLSLYS
ncbi:Cache domain-containing protein [Alkalithermobacter thermoalcaliphilus JW-YL-7 = DSM 7308]|uniref:Cache domain-containing protein n=1 Tax=Alkalithermobacter thermoalcaliphilus JW-YL-7 = DSM 7308 TaxID=1121328 RepID=A0A150FSB1_CLOPD|nr:Cache domain containing protein [[Clostridium] paradoxum JW-YL-7 = DSM 7308]SHL15927.1 Cache domain-containing protein [[Clostridium] paradoxum JW-YL-7 = DSM 7308]